MEQEFVIEETGEKAPEFPDVALTESSERVLGILAMIKDPDQSLCEINKAIAMEIAYVSMQMAESVTDVTKSYRISALKEQVKALRELAKTLIESDSLAKRDFLNLDGPKFQFVLGELMKLYKKSIVQSGLTEAQANDVLRTFRDLIAVYEPTIKKEVDRIGTNR